MVQRLLQPLHCSEHRLLLLVCLLFALVPGRAGAQEVTPLTIGEPIARDLGAHAAHAYTLTLGEGQFVYGDVNQQTVDVVVTVYAPDGDVVPAFDNPARGPEPFQFNTEEAGTYRVEVRTLLDGVQPAGARSVVWNGRDDIGRRLSTGVYTYQLVHQGGAAVGQVVLIR